ncbi:hypothetical protein SLS58_010750 [Diplodia intermedia]|uniref:Uncharacterized protein n=1 Tax=Diplodia intermedia TaxID=856260 RepID=A0ABR3T3Y9_9PEZI
MATHPFFDTFDCIVQESALIQWVDTATKQSRHLGQPGPPQDAAAADFSLLPEPATTWIRCHQGLVLDNRVEKSNGPFILPLTLKDKIKDLIDFVYTKVDRCANIYILDEVTQLRHASLRVEAARADENLDEGMAVKEFSCRLAFCVVMAFYKSWGSAELQTV